LLKGVVGALAFGVMVLITDQQAREMSQKVWARIKGGGSS
jgi:hypothetical protein